MCSCCCCCGDGPVSSLLKLYCNSGCQGKLVAAALSFHPPSPPYYKITPISLSIDDNKVPPNSTAVIQQRDSTSKPPFQLIFFIDDIGPFVPEAYLIPCIKQKNEKVAITIYRRPKASLVLLYSHGNATDLGAMHHVLDVLSRACNITVVCYDYSGYGSSTGTPSEQCTYDNIYTVYTYMKTNNIITSPDTDLVCYGESIGSGPAVWLCSKIKCAGLILHCPIASGLRVVTDNRLLCCCDIFPNIYRIRNVKCSTFIIHGVEDQQVDYKHGMNLYNALPKQFAYNPWWVEGAGHNSVRQVSGDVYLQKINNFVQFLNGDGLNVEENITFSFNEHTTNSDNSSIISNNINSSVVGAGKHGDRDRDTSSFVFGRINASSMVYPEDGTREEKN